MRFIQSAAVISLVLMVGACREEENASEPVIRGLKVHEIEERERTQTRRFPGVLEPSDLTVISFEVGGTLDVVELDVGQRLDAGDRIALLDTATLAFQVEGAEAAVAQAQANARNAEATLVRQEELLSRGSTTRVAVDNARTQAQAAAAALEQAEASLDSALENLEKAELRAPFDGVVNSVEATSFATVSPGTPIASMYSAKGFEVSFSVSFDAVSQLVIGTPAQVRLADRPDITLSAVVSEIGARADAVSSFPIVLELRETHPVLKAGMAVEAAIDYPLPTREGYTLPLSALIKDGLGGSPGDGQERATAGVFVYDAESSTVERREVKLGGIRENMLVVTEGLEIGDLVASAGVSFLKEGQEVRLLDGRD
ncbi:efflux RND transporter periplasmic adaptor subunit [Sulfitobacter sp. JBTF-M27]|uniref:Efflux RND transporter periplasmic adaptor subunit n=1 Tax=Sulfitobacter sediminilitoris TaxID=2698830 RepID=A0A6P0CEV5_9RHOB|nr:efflux RND transporter periplasmic adaptor subunit [Sulfitobacter sediminilitoris]NEK24702.1 efflux RND transporter periplasmic adaptor subunit [Sulfitobacter sediminilitoris]